MKICKDMAEIQLSTKYENVVHARYLDIVDMKPEYLILTPNSPYIDITGWLYGTLNHHI